MSASTDMTQENLDPEQHWRDIVDVFKQEYARGSGLHIKSFIKILENTFGTHFKTMKIPGNGACLLSSLNATLEEGKVILSRDSQYIYENYKTIKGQMIDFLEMNPGDLTDDSKNDLSVYWLDAIANWENINITVFTERNGSYNVHKFKPHQKDGNTTHYLLLHNGHFWPVVPKSKEHHTPITKAWTNQ